MIRKTVIFALALFVIYNIFTTQFRRPWFFPAPNMFHNNRVCAQELIYGSNQWPVIVAGTSITRSLVEALPATWCDFGLNGLSTADSLEIILKSGSMPRAVLVELNVMSRLPNKEFVDSLFIPGISSLRRWLPALQAKYEPASFVLGCMKVALGYRQWHSKEGLAMGGNSHEQSAESKRVADLFIQQNLEKVQSASERRDVEICANIIKGQVDLLRTKGVHVILFEVPENEALFNSPGREYERQVVRGLMPESSYVYLRTPDCREYQTTDGYHLDAASAVKYCKYLIPEVNRLLE